MKVGILITMYDPRTLEKKPKQNSKTKTTHTNKKKNPNKLCVPYSGLV